MEKNIKIGVMKCNVYNYVKTKELENIYLTSYARIYDELIDVWVI